MCLVEFTVQVSYGMECGGAWHDQRSNVSLQKRTSQYKVYHDRAVSFWCSDAGSPSPTSMCNAKIVTAARHFLV